MSGTPIVSIEIIARDGDARAGVLTTPHGSILTPTFMPVGTQGCVKGLSPDEVASTGARIVLGNTYHLWLRPGADIIASFGGLHQFSRWPHAMLTDSGGFQAFSLAQNCKRHDDGFVFRSHLDGSKHQLTPEVAVQVQRQLGADIAMQLDVCPPGGAPAKEVRQACALTTAWAKRCLDKRAELDERQGEAPQALFGIVQGGSDVTLRLQHTAELAALPFEGLALGGFSVGEPIEQMHQVLAQVAPKLPQQRPRYLMGVGKPLDLVRAIGCGVDMFDCVLPTRNARNGQALTRAGRVVLKQARYKTDPAVLEPGCGCAACAGGYSRAYLRHLLMAGELLVLRLVSIHNLWLYGQLVAEARAAIIAGQYASFRQGWLARWSR
ncbi:MAG TPA: tRNA guanosine(34) transglycosylase Tgt [Sorangium sp.]|nr:tRNA guanosine(34) transglycosylase Tgt [Sorangium sp.]